MFTQDVRKRVQIDVKFYFFSRGLRAANIFILLNFKIWQKNCDKVIVQALEILLEWQQFKRNIHIVRH